jgi:pimeloyl-ACP methyl ester carboxylesterase
LLDDKPNKPVLIFIPGANGTGDIFLPLAEQLKDHFTVVAVDRRDYGESCSARGRKMSPVPFAPGIKMSTGPCPTWW